MAFRKKPVPTRRGRLRKETTVTETAEAEAAVTEETTTTRRTAKTAAVATEKGGLEMALVVVTLVTLVAAFALIQLGMRKAFGAGWPF
jgi:hypothetical protein